MTTKVTKESLAENIGRLESYGDLSLNEEYQLKTYRLLLNTIDKLEDAEELLAGVHYEFDNENASISKQLADDIGDFLWGNMTNITRQQMATLNRIPQEELEAALKWQKA